MEILELGYFYFVFTAASYKHGCYEPHILFFDRPAKIFNDPLFFTLDRLSHMNTQDQVRHRHHIKLLAQELNRSAEEIAPVYDDVLTRLKEQATVNDFLPILTSKKVRSLFNRRDPAGR